jgi:plastocyanin
MVRRAWYERTSVVSRLDLGTATANVPGPVVAVEVRNPRRATCTLDCASARVHVRDFFVTGRHALAAVVIGLCVGGRVLAATKMVDVGPEGTLTFRDEESGSTTTTIDAGDSVQWVWQSSGHSTTSDQATNGWNSQVQEAPFTFTQQFPVAGSFPYHCIPHQALGMVGKVVVQPTGTATTTTTMPSVKCTDAQAVTGARAQVDAQCPCASAASHGAYVRCAARVLSKAVKGRTLPAACKVGIRQCVARSTCGRSGFVACCRTGAAGRTTCNVKRSAAACKAPKGGRACPSTQASCCDACTATGCAP